MQGSERSATAGDGWPVPQIGVKSRRKEGRNIGEDSGGQPGLKRED